MDDKLDEKVLDVLKEAGEKASNGMYTELYETFWQAANISKQYGEENYIINMNIWRLAQSQ